MAAKFGLSLKTRFTISDDNRPQAESTIRQHHEIFSELRLFTAQHLGFLSKKSWKRLEIPVGLKLRLELLLDPQRHTSLDFETLPSLSKLSIISATRMTLRTEDGQVYEVDRFCPHKGADLQGATTIGSVLICPKHRWKFDLSKGGLCVEGKSSCTLNSRALSW